MKTIGIVEMQFSASHTVLGHPLCGERHGHVWRVRVESPLLDAAFIPNIRSIVGAYHLRDLDRYMPGVESTCSGLASFFHEQFSPYAEFIETIEVITDDGFGARVEWPIR